MRVITIQRTIAKGQRSGTSTNRRSIRQIAGDFFARENHWEFAIEAFIFGLLLAVSVWPIATAAGAIHQFLASVSI
jgi:hypothetical protein